MNLTKENSGRSMIEMLGVLAVIAVLSVAGIEGYSKAMAMWKLDKWSSTLVQMIVEIQSAYINQNSYGESVVDLTSSLKSAGIISEEMLDEDNRDMFGSRVTVLTRYWSKYGLRLNIYYQMKTGKEAVDCCKKLYELGQEMNSSWVVTSENFSYSVCGKAAPEQYRKDMNCQDYNLATIAEKCKTCLTANCSIIFLLDNNSF